jgi:hypothetical protein
MLSPRFAEVMLNEYNRQHQVEEEPSMIYYLSGPMTGLPDYNRPAFNEAAAELRSHGFTVWNPAEEFDATTIYPRKIYIRKDIEALLKSDAIVMLDGWENSAGARLELDMARELELPIFFMRTNTEEVSVE